MSEGSRRARKGDGISERPRGDQKRRIPAILAFGGAVLSLVGIFLGRGADQGMELTLARLFLLVIGSSVCVAGLVGLVARAFCGNGEAS